MGNETSDDGINTIEIYNEIPKELYYIGIRSWIDLYRLMLKHGGNPEDEYWVFTASCGTFMQGIPRTTRYKVILKKLYLNIVQEIDGYAFYSRWNVCEVFHLLLSGQIRMLTEDDLAKINKIMELILLLAKEG